MLIFSDNFNEYANTNILAHPPSGALGFWEAGNVGLWSISVAGTRIKPSSATTKNVVMSSITPGINNYKVEADFFVRTVDINNTWSGVAKHLSTSATARGMVLKIQSNGTAYNSIRCEYLWESTTVTIGSNVTIAAGTLVAGDSGHAMLESYLISGTNYQVNCTITRASDGFYLNSSGTWQAGATYCITGTIDDAARVAANPMPAPGKGGLMSFQSAGDVGLHWDNFSILDGALFSVFPATVTTNSTNTLTLTNSVAGWIPGTPGTPNFTVSSGTKNSQVVNSATSATISFTAPAGAGTVTLTDAGTGATVTITVSASLVMGTLTPLIGTTNAALLECSPSYGQGPYTHELHRSLDPAFVPGPGTLIATQAGNGAISWSDTTALASETYAYKQKTTDANGLTGTTAWVCASKWQMPITLGYVGDSLFAQGTLQTRINDLLASSRGPRKVGVAINMGVSGSKASDWVSGSTNLNNALAAFATGGVTHVLVMLGTNFETVSTPNVTLYTNSMQSLCNTLVGAGYTVWILAPPYRSDAVTGASAISQYRAALSGLDNGTTIRFLNDRQLQVVASGYVRYSTGSYLNADRIHYSSTGGPLGADAIVQAIDNLLYGDGSGGGNDGIFGGGVVL